MVGTVPTVLAHPTWTALADAHATRVDGLTAAHRQRAAAGRAHPVEDFLFTYYSLRPGQLRRWHPGAGVVLTGPPDLPALRERAGWRWHHLVEVDGMTGVTLDLDAYLADRGGARDHIVALLQATAGRPPRLGCFGLHEWAMVHAPGQEGRRHASWPLRLGQEGTDRVVRESRLRCTHFDAYRFFTDAARPRNDRELTRATQVDTEQPGCLHATMDLYKWAYKLGPLVPSALTARCFALAREVRELDMRASPYDLTALGLTPVTIETPEGRAEYVRLQQDVTARGQQLRAALLDACTTPVVTAV
ncbi:3-methyladenine DNA glycosylase [Paraconexibacter algicola]|uniref:3-methyladenine DNA glycosylase n=1 Tax=Paraconexibacter algicola TaxID=2133960 RepID=A0A2T4ULA2_9ACTN|nr:3-methyladenine DNA glycosylase [Paraconexibacter algicola]